MKQGSGRVSSKKSKSFFRLTKHKKDSPPPLGGYAAYSFQRLNVTHVGGRYHCPHSVLGWGDGLGAAPGRVLPGG